MDFSLVTKQGEGWIGVGEETYFFPRSVAQQPQKVDAGQQITCYLALVSNILFEIHGDS